MTIRYTFKDCVVGNTNVVEEWLRQQPKALSAKFYSDFKYFAVTPKGQWPYKKTFKLTGEFSGLREFKTRVGRVRYRLAGFAGPGEGEETLCTGWTRSQSNAVQKAAKKCALDLKERVEQGEVTTVDHAI